MALRYFSFTYSRVNEVGSLISTSFEIYNSLFEYIIKVLLKCSEVIFFSSQFSNFVIAIVVIVPTARLATILIKIKANGETNVAINNESRILEAIIAPITTRWL